MDWQSKVTECPQHDIEQDLIMTKRKIPCTTNTYPQGSIYVHFTLRPPFSGCHWANMVNVLGDMGMTLEIILKRYHCTLNTYPKGPALSLYYIFNVIEKIMPNIASALHGFRIYYSSTPTAQTSLFSFTARHFRDTRMHQITYGLNCTILFDIG